MTIRLILKSFSYVLMLTFIRRIVSISNKFLVKIKGPIFFPIKKKIFNLLRSPHADKDSRDQLEIRKYKFVLIVSNPDYYFVKELLALDCPSVVKIFLRLITA